MKERQSYFYIPRLFESEREAVLFLYSHDIRGHVTIYTDSKLLEEIFLKEKAEFKERWY